MIQKDSGTHLQTIVIGDSADVFVRCAVEILSSYEVDYVLCSDVYAAAGRLGKTTRANVLVAGRIEQLSREGGWIFKKANGGGFSCCCLVDLNLTGRRKQIASAKKAGTFVINDPDEIEMVVVKLLTDNSALSPAGGVNSSVFLKERFFATKEEMDALLGA